MRSNDTEFSWITLPKGYVAETVARKAFYLAYLAVPSAVLKDTEETCDSVFRWQKSTGSVILTQSWFLGIDLNIHLLWIDAACIVGFPSLCEEAAWRQRYPTYQALISSAMAALDADQKANREPEALAKLNNATGQVHGLSDVGQRWEVVHKPEMTQGLVQVGDKKTYYFADPEVIGRNANLLPT